MANMGAGFEPASFVVAVEDSGVLENNLGASTAFSSGRHQWILVENRGNARFDRITRLYEHGRRLARNDVLIFIHQDVFLPDDWEERFFAALHDLDSREPSWGIVGPAGVVPLSSADPPNGPMLPYLRGHWIDPRGEHFAGPLPHAVQSLDEMLLCTRASRNVHFDEGLPGFHCYGIDICLGAREAGHGCYAVDAPAWHKRRDGLGRRIERPEQSEAIRRRWFPEFLLEFEGPSTYVDAKWRARRPFQSTSFRWCDGYTPPALRAKDV